MNLSQLGEAFGGAGAEGTCGKKLRKAAVFEHGGGGLIHGGERYLDAAASGEVRQRPHIGVIAAVGAVFVFDLDQNHGAAARNLTRGHNVIDATEIVGGRLHERRGKGAHRRVPCGQPVIEVGNRGRVPEEPSGEAATIELRADVGARAHDRAHSLGLHGVQESTEIQTPAGVPFPPHRLV